MFDILFGWSKASKCKRAIKRARCRLKLLKNKRVAIAKLLRKDLAELIQSGHVETAVNRVDQLIEDESLAAAYELLDHYCEFLLTQFSYIRRNKDCPNDINEAASSLIFASARCGELPELFVIRKLFGERYSEKFAANAVELFPGNLVNKQLEENLSGRPVSEDLKYRLVDEIARDNCIQQQVLAIKYYPDWQQEKVKENKEYQLVDNAARINDTIAGSKVHPSEIEEIKSDATSFNSTLIDVSAMVNFPGILSYTTSGMQNKVKRMALPSSLYPEEMVDYANDIEEREFSVIKDGTVQDQMLFKFKPSSLSRREKNQLDCEESDTDRDESSSSEKSSTRSSRRSKRAAKKRSRRRSASLESVGIMDTGYMIYYHKRGTHYRRNHHKPSTEENYQSRRKSFDVKMRGCSLDQPCYFCMYDGNKEIEAESSASVGSYASNLRTNGPLTRTETEAPYSRAMTMPQGRRGNNNDKMLRTYSCPPPQHPNHVHPKLPDYDDIAAKFTALKRECQGNKVLK